MPFNTRSSASEEKSYVFRERKSRKSKGGGEYHPPAFVRRVSKEAQSRLIYDFLEQLGCARALTVWMLYADGSQEAHRQLLELVFDVRPFESADEFRNRYQATKFLSKFVGLNSGIDKERVAIDTARRAELRCAETNASLRHMRSSGVIPEGLTPDILLKAKGLIAQVLIDSTFSSEKVSWSSGRTSCVSGIEKSATQKYCARLDVLPSSAAFALRMLRDSPLWGAACLNADGPCSVLERALEYREGNEMITVPKNAKTDRVICYEPHLNIRLQRMVGECIARGLRRHGVNLRDQSVNQRRAKLASSRGKLATLDLKSASDTLSVALVEELLPVDWVILLNALRSKSTRWPGEASYTWNQKFSSMGNGFTFELESLIFWAVSMAVCGSGVSVYGDDIIVPSDCAGEVVNALHACGFDLNLQKSFIDGPFRESCGCDAYLGADVTPVYLRDLIITRERVVHLHNAVREWQRRSGCPELRYHSMLAKWRALFPSLYGPSSKGDGHYHVDLDVATPSRASHYIDGWWYETYVREYADAKWDNLDLHFPSRLGYGALCVATGPKRSKSVWENEKRGAYRVRKHRALANSWPEMIWV